MAYNVLSERECEYYMEQVRCFFVAIIGGAMVWQHSFIHSCIRETLSRSVQGESLGMEALGLTYKVECRFPPLPTYKVVCRLVGDRFCAGPGTNELWNHLRQTETTTGVWSTRRRCRRDSGAGCRSS